MYAIRPTKLTSEWGDWPNFSLATFFRKIINLQNCQDLVIFEDCLHLEPCIAVKIYFSNEWLLKKASLRNRCLTSEGLEGLFTAWTHSFQSRHHDGNVTLLVMINEMCE